MALAVISSFCRASGFRAQALRARGRAKKKARTFCALSAPCASGLLLGWCCTEPAARASNCDLRFCRGCLACSNCAPAQHASYPGRQRSCRGKVGVQERAQILQQARARAAEEAQIYKACQHSQEQQGNVVEALAPDPEAEDKPPQVRRHPRCQGRALSAVLWKLLSERSHRAWRLHAPASAVSCGKLEPSRPQRGELRLQARCIGRQVLQERGACSPVWMDDGAVAAMRLLGYPRCVPGRCGAARRRDDQVSIDAGLGVFGPPWFLAVVSTKNPGKRSREFCACQQVAFCSRKGQDFLNLTSGGWPRVSRPLEPKSMGKFASKRPRPQIWRNYAVLH